MHSLNYILEKHNSDIFQIDSSLSNNSQFSTFDLMGLREGMTELFVQIYNVNTHNNGISPMSFTFPNG